MPEQNNTEDQAHDAPDGNENAFSARPWVFILIGGWAVLILTAIFHPYMDERVKFITEMGMGFTVVVAVIAQIEVSRRQWQVMRKAIHRQDADLRQWVEIRRVGIMTDTQSETTKWRLLSAGRLLTLRASLSLSRGSI